MAVPVESCYQVNFSDMETTNKCSQVPRRHCQSVPVKRPRVVTQNVPRQICVTSSGGSSGGGSVGGGLGGAGGLSGGGYGGGTSGGVYSSSSSGGGLGGFADHRKDEFKNEAKHIVQKRKIDENISNVQVNNSNINENLLTSKPFDDVIFVSTKPESQKFSLKDLDKFKFK